MQTEKSWSCIVSETALDNYLITFLPPHKNSQAAAFLMSTSTQANFRPFSSSGGQNFDMDLTGLKSSCWHGCIPSGNSSEKFIFLPFSASRGHTLFRINRSDVTGVTCTRMPRLTICSKIAQKVLPCIPLLHTSPLCLQPLSAGLHICPTLFKSCASRNHKNICLHLLHCLNVA
nr:uncharacterized protein LOC105729489 [Aotus nancymaae]